jgi:hypothetical protein
MDYGPKLASRWLFLIRVMRVGRESVERFNANKIVGVGFIGKNRRIWAGRQPVLSTGELGSKQQMKAKNGLAQLPWAERIVGAGERLAPDGSQ